MWDGQLTVGTGATSISPSSLFQINGPQRGIVAQQIGWTTMLWSFIGHVHVPAEYVCMHSSWQEIKVYTLKHINQQKSVTLDVPWCFILCKNSIGECTGTRCRNFVSHLCDIYRDGTGRYNPMSEPSTRRFIETSKLKL